MRIAGQTKDAEQRAELYYSWAYYTHSGVRFGFWRGLLKLQMSPAIIYRNMPNQRTAYFSTNRYGYRGAELLERENKLSSATEITADSRNLSRVILLGGSTAFGTGLASDAETAAVKLGHFLCVETINAAVIGHRSGQELAFLATELLDLKPDLILTLNGWNDFSQYWLANFERGPFGFCAFELIDAKIEEAQQTLSAPLLLRPWKLSKFLFPLLGRSLTRKPRPDHASLTGADWKIPLLAESFAKNMQKSARLCQSAGVDFCCFLQPVRTLRDGKNDSYISLYAEFRNLVKQNLIQGGVPFADLNEPASEPSLELGDDLFRDLTHLTAQGQSKLAQVIVQKLNELELRP